MAPPFRAWPYAALAVVQYLHTAPSLYLWIVFRHPMDQTVTPPLATWIVSVDGVPKTPAISVWVDEWTLLLTVAAIPALPASVTVEYDGPDENLRTTWQKQWEPWGAIVATSFQLIPPGVIVIWHGAVVDIPPGWVLCDGNNGTPDLRNRMIEGAGGALNPNDIGGTDLQTHSFSADWHIHTTAVPWQDRVLAAGTDKGIAPTTVTGWTSWAENRPAFYALAYIQKL